MCAQPVPLQAVQVESLKNPPCLPLPPHRAHFLAGGMTSTLPFPSHAGQGVSTKKPSDFPRPLHKAQSWGEPYRFTTFVTGLPQWLQKLLSFGIVFPHDEQRMVPPLFT